MVLLDSYENDSTPILTLPPIDSAVVSVNLTKPEREFYNACKNCFVGADFADHVHYSLIMPLLSLFHTVLERSQSVFEGYVKAGTAAKSWFAIFSLLQR